MSQSSSTNCGLSNPDCAESNAASAPTSAEKPAYNVVYQKLVTSEKDIVGQLAYCLYKRSKQQYLQEFERLNSRRATASELFNHVACAEIPALSMYREKAQLVFLKLLRQVAGEKQNEVQKYFKGRLWQFINRYQPESFGERSWLYFKALTFGGFGGVIGNFLTTVIVLLLLLGAATSSNRDEFSKSAKENLISGLAEVIGVTVSITRSTPAPALEPLP